MINEMKAKIFSGAERGLTESDWFRTANLFNSGKYINEHRDSFESLYLLNEETLAPERSLTCEVAEESWLLIIPVWGALKYAGIGHGTYSVQAGELLLVPASRRHSYSIFHAAGKDPIHFLQIGLRTKDELAPLRPHLRSMNMKNYHNKLHAALDARDPYPFQFYIGQYEGRVKGHHQWEGHTHNLFVYVIQGALEMEERLLHAGDGLGLWGTNSLEWEALSAYGLFIVIAFR